MSTSRVTLSANEKISLLSNLSTMLTAGISILEAVDSVLLDSKGNTKKILETLRSDLMSGKHIYTSFSAYPRVFDSVTVNLLRAAEEAGTLEKTLMDLKDHIQKETEFMDKVKLAMVYPVLIFLVFIGVLMVILVFVVPRIAAVFSRLKVTLPLPTRVLIFASDIVTGHPIPLALGLVSAVLVFLFVYRQYRPVFMYLLFSLPLISGLIKLIDLTRFTRTLHLLLSSGLPIDTALQLAGNVVLRPTTARLIARSRDMVLQGKKLADGLRSTPGVIPGIMIKLVEVGEKSGGLDKAMLDISVHLDYQVSNALKTLTSVLEPVMLLVVGLAVGGMMMAIIAPIYGLIGQVSYR